jgi:pimeloyl-ACP methyl ester carboxylesterase
MTSSYSVGAEPESIPLLRLMDQPSLLLEQRAPLELASLLLNPVYYGCGVPRGDGSSVLVLPGFMGSDSYLRVIRGWLRRIGYTPRKSEIGFNAGNPFDLVTHVLHRAEDIAEEDGQRIIIVGHSLGGILGRLAGRLRPDTVEHVITLGSPLHDSPRRATHPVVRRLADVMIRDPEMTPRRARARERELIKPILQAPMKPRVGLTSIFSKQDPVVDWRACIPDEEHSEAYEVTGTHCGLSWNEQVYRLVARLLHETIAERSAEAEALPRSA